MTRYLTALILRGTHTFFPLAYAFTDGHAVNRLLKNVRSRTNILWILFLQSLTRVCHHLRTCKAMSFPSSPHLTLTAVLRPSSHGATLKAGETPCSVSLLTRLFIKG